MCQAWEEATDCLKKRLDREAVILVKGSNGMHLSRLVGELTGGTSQLERKSLEGTSAEIMDEKSPIINRYYSTKLYVHGVKASWHLCRCYFWWWQAIQKHF